MKLDDVALLGLDPFDLKLAEELATSDFFFAPVCTASSCLELRELIHSILPVDQSQSIWEFSASGSFPNWASSDPQN